MSRNNTDYWNPALGDVKGMMSERLEDYPDTTPVALAFSTGGVAGADPAPGDYGGHDAWGERMAIHETVMEVRHFIAAHEIRNSFPVDSISMMGGAGMTKPAHFHETVYPGSHSDVGGGYAPGEGAKAMLPKENFCLIPLRHMYDSALRQGVPLLPIKASRNMQDFDVSDDLRKAYDGYSKAVGVGSGVGDLMNKHREMYFSWRFSSIKRKLGGECKEAGIIKEYSDRYRSQEKLMAAEVSNLAKVESSARVKYDLLMRAQQVGVGPMATAHASGRASAPDFSAVKAARQQYLEARDNRLRAEAKRNAIPNMENYQAMLDIYDQQLMEDAKSILSALSRTSDKNLSVQRKNLRPHYRALINAYENEFHKNTGLRDADTIALFDFFVHDSLAGFARDATLPSDPRVVFVGGDRKLLFAARQAREEDFSHRA